MHSGIFTTAHAARRTSRLALLLHTLARRRRVLFTLAVLGVLGGGLVVCLRPKVYYSRAIIEPPSWDQPVKQDPFGG